MPMEFDFRDGFQEMFLSCLMREPKHFLHVAPEIKTEYFTGAQPRMAARCMLEHFERYKRFPTWEALDQRLHEACSQVPESEFMLVTDFVKRLQELDVSDWEFVRDHVTDFLAERALVGGIRRAVDMLQENTAPVGRVTSVFAEALQEVQALQRLGRPQSRQALGRRRPATQPPVVRARQ